MIDYNRDLAATIGRNLRDRRRIAYPRDTQKEMAVRIGVSIATYSRMERGDATVSFRHYLAAATLLHCEGQFSELYARPDKAVGLIDSLVREAEKKMRKKKR